jgi:hypothetical protein
MSGIVVAVYLTDSTNNKYIWGETHRYGAESGQFSTFQEEVAYSIVVKTSDAHGVIAKPCPGSRELFHLPICELMKPSCNFTNTPIQAFLVHAAPSSITII